MLPFIDPKELSYGLMLYGVGSTLPTGTNLEVSLNEINDIEGSQEININQYLTKEVPSVSPA